MRCGLGRSLRIRGPVFPSSRGDARYPTRFPGNPTREGPRKGQRSECLLRPDRRRSPKRSCPPSRPRSRPWLPPQNGQDRSIALAIVTVALAPLVGWFFNVPEVTWDEPTAEIDAPRMEDLAVRPDEFVTVDRHEPACVDRAGEATHGRDGTEEDREKELQGSGSAEGSFLQERRHKRQSSRPRLERPADAAQPGCELSTRGFDKRSIKVDILAYRRASTALSGRAPRLSPSDETFGQCGWLPGLQNVCAYPFRAICRQELSLIFEKRDLEL